MFFLRFHARFVGEDACKNRYFESINKDFFGRRRRFCVYFNKKEASKIMPHWYGWMHHQVSLPPTMEIGEEFSVETKTGTKDCFSPIYKKPVFRYKSWCP